LIHSTPSQYGPALQGLKTQKSSHPLILSEDESIYPVLPPQFTDALQHQPRRELMPLAAFKATACMSFTSAVTGAGSRRPPVEETIVTPLWRTVHGMYSKCISPPLSPSGNSLSVCAFLLLPNHYFYDSIQFNYFSYYTHFYI